MISISNIKFVTSNKRQNLTPIAQKRIKLLNGLNEQLELIQAKIEGRTYAPIKSKWMRNPVTGEKTKIDSPKRVKEWFWVAEGGKIHLSIRYGSRTLELAKGKNAIELDNLDALPETLNALIKAVQEGKFDSEIEKAALSTKRGFKK